MPKISQVEDTFWMYTVSMFQPQIRYILGDMIPPNQDSILFQDSSLNRTPRENCYISGYEGPNEISKDFIDRAWTLISMVKVSDLEGETLTCGSPYDFAVLNNPVTGYLGKMIISPNL